jgi:excisionase family DNA binding protein
MANRSRSKAGFVAATDSSSEAIEGRLLLVEEAAERSQLSVAFWRREIARGAIPVMRFGRSVRIDEADFMAHLAARRSRGRSK